MGKTLTFFVCDFLRVIHSNFCMEKIHSKNVWQFFVCALHSKFLYGKNTNIFCMVFFVWYFCMGKTLTFLCGNFLYGVFLVFDPSFSLFIHPLVLPFC